MVACACSKDNNACVEVIASNGSAVDFSACSIKWNWDSAVASMGHGCEMMVSEGTVMQARSGARWCGSCSDTMQQTWHPPGFCMGCLSGHGCGVLQDIEG